MATVITARGDTKAVIKCIRCIGRGGTEREKHKEVCMTLATSPL